MTRECAGVAAGTQLSRRTAAWFEKNEPFCRDILALLERKARCLPGTSRTQASSHGRCRGWTNNRNVTKMLEILAYRGYVAISGGKGRQRDWDLAQRVYPAGLPIRRWCGTTRPALE